MTPRIAKRPPQIAMQVEHDASLVVSIAHPRAWLDGRDCFCVGSRFLYTDDGSAYNTTGQHHAQSSGFYRRDPRAPADVGTADSGSLRRAAVAEHRSVPGRPRHCGRRIASSRWSTTWARPAAALEDRRRWPDVEQRVRRLRAHRLGRRRRCIAVGSEHRLRRHGRGLPARESVVGRRHLQIDRRGQDVDARRPCRHQSDRPSQVHPTNPSLVYVAAIGHPFGANAERGVFRTKDGGKTWQKVLYVDDKTGAADIAMDATNPQVLYATTWQVLRTPWDIYSTGPGSALYKSIDGGDTWSKLDDRAAVWQPRKDRRRRVASQPATRVGDGGSRVERRDLSIRRRGPNLAVVERRLQHDRASVLLRPHLRRPGRCEHRIHVLREVLLQVDRRRQDVHERADAAQRLPRFVDRSQGSEADGERQRRRRIGDLQRRPDLELAWTISRRRSSTR